MSFTNLQKTKQDKQNNNHHIKAILSVKRKSIFLHLALRYLVILVPKSKPPFPRGLYFSKQLHPSP